MRSVKHSGLNFQNVALALAGTGVNTVFRSFGLEPPGVKGEIEPCFIKCVTLGKFLR